MKSFHALEMFIFIVFRNFLESKRHFTLQTHSKYVTLSTVTDAIICTRLRGGTWPVIVTVTVVRTRKQDNYEQWQNLLRYICFPCLTKFPACARLGQTFHRQKSIFHANWRKQTMLNTKIYRTVYVEIKILFFSATTYSNTYFAPGQDYTDTSTANSQLLIEYIF